MNWKPRCVFLPIDFFFFPF
uniref:Uncharacterized protein n=1 Tax=Anguilla anguilla TaxID=7936 RepID=A0A0E9QV92_ANGAN